MSYLDPGNAELKLSVTETGIPEFRLDTSVPITLCSKQFPKGQH